jgi:hypothetical protein
MKYQKLLGLAWVYCRHTGTYTAEVPGVPGGVFKEVMIKWKESPSLTASGKTRYYPCLYTDGVYVKAGHDVALLSDAIADKFAARFDEWYDKL